ncbi:hypothetical protein pdam_00019699 [Pocillopora damicornis]|uniref:Uncharacterized protein n=1 Tax=Pocillopora damicornis TaxID=46731 RepID=A0A3M6UXS9_POCDA|nr:hypothetical protein pdam_00019699 [Pocillopora damicornis]
MNIHEVVIGTDFCLESLDVPDCLGDSLQESKLEENKNQEIKERRDIQDNICGRLSVLESDFEALKEEVCALERKRQIFQ